MDGRDKGWMRVERWDGLTLGAAFAHDDNLSKLMSAHSYELTCHDLI